MKVSEVQITPIKARDGLVAFASVVLNDELYLGSIGVHVRLDGTYRITYPTKMVGERQVGICHPIRRETGRVIDAAVIQRCQELFERSEEYDRHSETGTENGSAAHH